MIKHFIKLFTINVLMYIALRLIFIAVTESESGSDVSEDYFVDNTYLFPFILQMVVLICFFAKNWNKELYRMVNYLIVIAIISSLFVCSQKGFIPEAFEYIF